MIIEKTLTTAGTTPATGILRVSDLGGGQMGIQLSGTFSARVEFVGSIDGTTFVALDAIPRPQASAVQEATAGGLWVADISGLRYFQLRVSAYVSGSVVCKLYPTNP
jgi:hypothetical protein